MFEELISRLLVRYIGEYVEGINTNALQISLISGQVEINNIRLKSSALNKFRLPVQIKEGFIGKLVLTIPWTSLYSSSVTVELSQLFVVVEPLEGDFEEEIDVEAEIQKAKQEKLKFADSMAQEFLQDQEDQGGWLSRMAATIVDNIQIEIRNVHVRYEDARTGPTPFFLGVTIESVSAHSTDSDWLEKVFVANTKIIHKFCELRSFALYWNNNRALDPNQSLHSSGTRYDESLLRDGPLEYDSSDDLVAQMQDLIYSETNECFPRHQYVLHPVSASLKLCINKDKPPVSGTKSRDKQHAPLNTDPNSPPKFTFEFLFEHVNLTLDVSQQQVLMLLIRNLDKHRDRLKLIKQKVAAHVHVEKTQFSQEEERRYVSLYKKQVTGRLKKIRDIDQFMRFEKEFSYDAIVHARMIARTELKHEEVIRKEEQQKASYISTAYRGTTATVAWLSSWVWTPDDSYSEDDTQALDVNDPTFVEILKFVHESVESENDPYDYPPDYVHTRFFVQIRTGSLSLSAKANPVVAASFHSLSFQMKKRPGMRLDYIKLKPGARDSMYKFQFTMGNPKIVIPQNVLNFTDERLILEVGQIAVANKVVIDSEGKKEELSVSIQRLSLLLHREGRNEAVLREIDALVVITNDKTPTALKAFPEQLVSVTVPAIGIFLSYPQYRFIREAVGQVSSALSSSDKSVTKDADKSASTALDAAAVNANDTISSSAAESESTAAFNEEERVRGSHVASKLEISFKNFALHLMSEIGAEPIQPFITLKASEFSIDRTVMANNDSLLELKLRSLHVLNEQAAVDQFKFLFAPRLGDTTSPQLTFTSQYTQSALSETELLDEYTYTLVFDKLRLYFVPQVFLVDIPAFFSSKSTAKDSNASETRKNEEAERKESESASQPEPVLGKHGERINCTTRWGVRVSEPEFCLLRDETERRTCGVVVTANIDFSSVDDSQRHDLLEIEKERLGRSNTTDATSTNSLPTADSSLQGKYALLIKNLKAHSCQFDNEKLTTVPILQPWTIYAHHHMCFPQLRPNNPNFRSSSGATHHMHQLVTSQIKLFPCQVMFSCQDILLISDIAKRFNSVSSSKSGGSTHRHARTHRDSADSATLTQSASATLQGRPSHHHYHAARFPRAKSSAPSRATPTAANSALNLKEVKPETVTTHLATVLSHGLECTLIDDSFDQNLPLLRLNLTTAELKGELSANSKYSHAATTQLRAKVSLELLYYASSHGVWESVLLPWTVLASYRDQCLLLAGANGSAEPCEHANRTRDVQVRAGAPLDLTVTKPFVDTLMRTHKAWDREYAAYMQQLELQASGLSPCAVSMMSKSTAERPTFAPFVIRNLTGFDVQYQVNSHGSAAASSDSNTPNKFAFYTSPKKMNPSQSRKAFLRRSRYEKRMLSSGMEEPLEMDGQGGTGRERRRGAMDDVNQSLTMALMLKPKHRPRDAKRVARDEDYADLKQARAEESVYSSDEENEDTVEYHTLPLNRIGVFPLKSAYHVLYCISSKAGARALTLTSGLKLKSECLHTILVRFYRITEPDGDQSKPRASVGTDARSSFMVSSGSSAGSLSHPPLSSPERSPIGERKTANTLAASGIRGQYRQCDSGLESYKTLALRPGASAHIDIVDLRELKYIYLAFEQERDLTESAQPTTSTSSSYASSPNSQRYSSQRDKSRLPAIRAVPLAAFLKHPQLHFDYHPYCLSVNHTDLHRATILVSPSVVIENQLAQTMNFTIVDSTTKREIVSDVMLEKGESHHLYYQYFDKHIIHMKLKLDNYEWSLPLQINYYDNSKVTEKSDVFTIEDDHDRSKKLYLPVAFEKTNKNLLITIYSNYWIINQTGMSLLYKNCDDFPNEEMIPGQARIEHYIQARDEEACAEWALQPLLYSPPPRANTGSAKGTPPNHYLSVKLGDTWSKPININTVGWEEVISLEATVDDKHYLYEFMTNIEPGSGKSFRTIMVTITPRYIIYNNMDCELLYRQKESEETFKVLASSHTPLFWVPGLLKDIHITLENEDHSTGEDALYSWSGGIRIDEIGKEAINIRNQSNVIKHMVQIEVKIEKAVTFVVFTTLDTKYPPYRIENFTPERVWVYQQGMAPKRQALEPYEAQAFTWEEPMSPHILILELDFPADTPFDDKLFEFNIDKVVAHSQALTSSQGLELKTEVVVDGPTKVFRVISALHHANYFAESKSASTAQPGNEKELFDVTKFNLHLDGIGVSLVDDVKELIYLSLRKINLNYETTDEEESVKFTVHSVQIDNQLREPIYPVILKHATNEEALHFFDIEYVKNNYYKDINFFHSFSVNKQGWNFTLNIEQSILEELVQYFAAFSNSDETNSVQGSSSVSKQNSSMSTPSFHVDSGAATPLTTKKRGGFVSRYVVTRAKERLARFRGAPLPKPPPIEGKRKKSYFGSLLIGPIKCLLSVKLNESATSHNGFVMAMLQSGLSAIVSIDNVPLTLNALLFKEPLMDMKQLLDIIKSKYSSQLVYQFYKLLGYNDLLGNPLQLISTFSSGVIDFFYEPGLSLVTNPLDLEEIVEGVRKGTSSFFEKSIYGLLNSASRFTGSVANLLASFLKNRKYKKIRANRVEPRGVGQALSIGISGLGEAAVDGFLGLMREPWLGYQERGYEGLLLGLGSGCLGVVLIPVLGMIDFVAVTASGVKNKIISPPLLTFRLHPPRCMAKDIALRDSRYSFRSSLGQYYLWKLIDATKYADHQKHYDQTYLFHIEDRELVCLLSDTHIYCFHVLADNATLDLEWHFALKDVAPDDVQQTKNGVIITHAIAGESSTLSGTKETKEFLVSSTCDGELVSQLYHHILTAMVANTY